MSEPGGIYLIVMRGPFGAGIVRQTGDDAGRLTGVDLETGAAWTGSRGHVLARHEKILAAHAALARVRKRGGELKKEVARATRAARRLRSQALQEIKREASHAG